MDIIELLKTVVIGVIQGITEWLPISSTGHMILADQLIHVKMAAADPAFWEMFLVIIQFGSILAVLTLYFHKLNPFSPKKSLQKKRQTWSLWAKVLVASIPAGVVGLLLDDFITGKLYGYVTVAVALVVGGLLILWIENRQERLGIVPRVATMDDMTWKDALAVGFCQCLAMIPGTSRSGATIIGGLVLGLSRKAATEFSFFLSIPTIFGATVYDLWKSREVLHTANLPGLAIGTAVSFLSALLVVHWLLRYVSTNNFKAFGWYRILFGVVILVTAATGWVSWEGGEAF